MGSAEYATYETSQRAVSLMHETIGLRHAQDVSQLHADSGFCWACAEVFSALVVFDKLSAALPEGWRTLHVDDDSSKDRPVELELWESST